MTYKVIFLDIDGTILKRDHTYTDLTKEAIQLAKEQGIEVFMATGRPIHEIKDLATELSIESFIGYNGAYATYQNETLVDEPMKEEMVKKIIHIAKENNHEMVLYTNGMNYLSAPEDPQVKLFKEIFQMQKNTVYTGEAADQVLGMTVMKLKSEQTSLYEIEPNLRLSQVNVEGAKHAYDIIRTNVNKGEAIKKVLNRLQIPKEQAIAFGDGMNDKEMLQSVGESFAMENAHPDLFQYAKHKTASVDNSGIYQGLKKLGLIK